MIPCTPFVRGTAGPLLMFLSILVVGPGVAVSRVGAEPILLGLYPPGPLASPAVVDTIVDVDTWLAPTGKRVTIAGTFVTVEDNPSYVPSELEGAWSRGYIPFVSFKSVNTATAIAAGRVDGPIRSWASQFALWAKNGQRRAFIAPLHEMNGNWNPYYGRPALFKQAYLRIRQIFNEELLERRVSHPAVSWAFAPNGWSRPGDEFEHYYPGPDVVDIVAVSGQPVKGTVTVYMRSIGLTPTPNPGDAIADAVRTSIINRTFDILIEGGGAGASVLAQFGVTVDRARDAVNAVLAQRCTAGDSACVRLVDGNALHSGRPPSVRRGSPVGH